MIWYYLAAALIASVLLWHFAAGGRQRALQVMKVEREGGKNRISDRGHNVIWFSVIAFLVASGAMFLLPSAPRWIEIAFAIIFLLYGLIDLLIQRGKKLSGYFALMAGILILAGNST